MRMYDVSHWNGDSPIELLHSFTDSPDIIYCKYSEGASIIQDEYFNKIKNEANKVGVLFGGYHYINPPSLKESSIEAERLDAIRAQTTLVPMMDFEEKRLIDDLLSSAEYLECVINRYLERTGGAKLGIYASYSVLRETALLKLIEKYDLCVWCARYKYKNTIMTPSDTIANSGRLLQTAIDSYPCVANQIATKYQTADYNVLNLDFNFVYRPADLLQ